MQLTEIILGIDVGTSGIRAVIVERYSPSSITSRDKSDKTSSNSNHQPQDKTAQSQYKQIAEAQVSMAIPQEDEWNRFQQDPNIWITALDQLLQKFSIAQLSQVTHLVADATSSTILLCNEESNPISQALMYNDNKSNAEALLIANWFDRYYASLVNPVTSNVTSNLATEPQQDYILNENTGTAGIGALGASSSLAKALNLQRTLQLQQSSKIMHQLDFIYQYLANIEHITDENNALKLGFDSIKFTWPAWVINLANNVNLRLPKVVKPGTEIGFIKNAIAKKYGFSRNLKIMAGTTDSIAGFLASGAQFNGDAVVSLGSSIAIKFISQKATFSPEQGLYSHRLGNYWLVGGASNAGGKIFMLNYNEQALSELTQAITEKQLAHYLECNRNQFYPLTTCGERFPIADANLKPRLPKQPHNQFIAGDAQSIDFEEHRDYVIKLSLGLSEIEWQAYKVLEAQTATPVRRIFTVGGGVKNQVWQQFRQQILPGKQLEPLNANAAYGVSKLLDFI